MQHVLGRPPLHHMADLLWSQSVKDIAVVSEYPQPELSLSPASSHAKVTWRRIRPFDFWRAAENVFTAFVQAGVDEVLVLKMGAYLHLDVQDLLAHHYEQKCRITATVDSNGLPLNVFAISANRRNDAAFLFRHFLQQTRTPCKDYVFRGYINRLENAQDLRQLASDALMQKIPLQPHGTELHPGVWIGRNARIHPGARIVAPAFIGERSQLLSGAVVTRCSSVEHHAVVSQSTAIENSTLLPYSRVGPGLEMNHVVAGHGRIMSIRHNAELEIGDSRLLSSVSPHAPMRLLNGLISFATHLPAQLLHDLFSFRNGARRTVYPSSEAQPSTVSADHPDRRQAAASSSLNQISPDLAEVAVARRYGND
ncbi:MAG TPA: hypothetical protein VG892_13440 [Terriglobales bacterium]|nr:hypothetical protein [Terriglobales bacterium]